MLRSHSSSWPAHWPRPSRLGAPCRRWRRLPSLAQTSPGAGVQCQIRLRNGVDTPAHAGYTALGARGAPARALFGTLLRASGSASPAAHSARRGLSSLFHRIARMARRVRPLSTPDRRLPAHGCRPELRFSPMRPAGRTNSVRATVDLTIQRGLRKYAATTVAGLRGAPPSRVRGQVSGTFWADDLGQVLAEDDRGRRAPSRRYLGGRHRAGNRVLAALERAIRPARPRGNRPAGSLDRRRLARRLIPGAPSRDPPCRNRGTVHSATSLWGNGYGERISR